MKKIIITLLSFFFLLSVFSLKAEDFLLSTPNTSLLLEANKEKPLHLQYYGSRIESPSEVYNSGTALWQLAYPAFGIETPQEAAVRVTHNDGNVSLVLLFDKLEKTKDTGSETWKFVLKDPVYPFQVNVCYKVYSKVDVIETWTEISHQEKKQVMLYYFPSASIPFRPGKLYLSQLHGAWANETQLSEEELLPGVKVIKSIDGVRNGQTDNPGLMLSVGQEPSENTGAVFGATLVWSGNYEMKIDTDHFRRSRLFAGINPNASQYTLMPNEIFQTPPLAITYSIEGKGGASRNFHRWARNYKLSHGNQLRDILLNSWEGVYLNITQDIMNQMMADIASLGGELFVMDDGWFGDKHARKTTVSGLGDWVVDKTKLPQGIEALVDTARKNNIKFGIWIEPEMVNRNSELYEKHPKWVIGQENRAQRYGRGGNQLVLDLSNPEVQDFIFGIVDNLMTKYPGIAYIKWDSNMSMYNYGSYYLPKDKQAHLEIEYHRGFNKVLERIRNKYPDLILQACGGGGGRMSYGTMQYMDEFWTSDNTDAWQRIFIQWGCSHFYPAIAMGAHVSATRNHGTGRVTPLKFRFDVAMSGRMGMELQPKDMSTEEKEFSRKAISDYKKIRPVVQLGDQYRLISPYDRQQDFASLMYVSEDKKEAVFFAYKLQHCRNQMIPRFKMAGLDADKKYRLEEINPENKPFGLQGKAVTGKFLMEEGLDLSLNKEYASVVVQLTEL